MGIIFRNITSLEKAAGYQCRSMCINLRFNPHSFTMLSVCHQRTTVFLGMPDSVHCTKERVETDGEVQTFIHFIKENV